MTFSFSKIQFTLLTDILLTMSPPGHDCKKILQVLEPGTKATNTTQCLLTKTRSFVVHLGEAIVACTCFYQNTGSMNKRCVMLLVSTRLCREGRSAMQSEEETMRFIAWTSGFPHEATQSMSNKPTFADIRVYLSRTLFSIRLKAADATTGTN